VQDQDARREAIVSQAAQVGVPPMWTGPDAGASREEAVKSGNCLNRSASATGGGSDIFSGLIFDILKRSSAEIAEPASLQAILLPVDMKRDTEYLLV
jgi:hypothetical protein